MCLFIEHFRCFPIIAASEADLSKIRAFTISTCFCKIAAGCGDYWKSAMNELLPSAEADGLSQTRSSLLGRLHQWDDRQAWNEFFETYWRFIFRSSIKAGLTEDEAQEVVQETMITVAKKLRAADYEYRPQQATFRTWLSQIVRYMVLRVRRGRKVRSERISEIEPALGDAATEWSAMEQIPDPADPQKAEEDREWNQNFMDVAAERVKRQVNPKHYQIFACRVIEGRGVTETARDMGVSLAQVYLVTHRMGKLLRDEYERLKKGDPVLPPAGPR